MLAPNYSERFLQQMETRTRRRLANWNTAVENNKMSLDDLIKRIGPMLIAISKLFRPLLNTLREEDLRRLAVVTGFLVGSLERHFQFQGNPPGTTWKFVPTAEAFISQLAKELQLPAAMSVYAYWLDNHSELSFTGDQGEIDFGKVVRVWNTNCDAATSTIRPICEGKMNIMDQDARHTISTAKGMIEEISSAYEVLRKQPDGSYGLTPTSFDRMRNYLAPWKVYGQIITGPNAANLRSQWSLDLLALSMDGYTELISDRMEFLTPADQGLVNRDMILPSLVDCFLEPLSLSRQSVTEISTELIARKMTKTPQGYLETLVEYRKFYQAIVTLSAKHWQTIQFILVKPFQGLTEEQLKKLPVPPTKSVGGATHDRPLKIFRMRQKDPLVLKLLKALKIVEGLLKAV